MVEWSKNQGTGQSHLARALIVPFSDGSLWDRKPLRPRKLRRPGVEKQDLNAGIRNDSPSTQYNTVSTTIPICLR